MKFERNRLQVLCPWYTSTGPGRAEKLHKPLVVAYLENRFDLPDYSVTMMANRSSLFRENYFEIP